MAVRAFVYKLYPTKAQQVALGEELELHRQLYNAALEHRRGAWKYGHKGVTYAEQNKELTLIRKDDLRYGQRSSSAQQRTLRRLDKAFAAFFRRVKAGQKPGYPRFKGRNRWDTVEYTAGNGARMESTGKRVSLHGIGSIKLRLYRPWQGVIKSIAFTRKASGWWLCLSCQLADQTAPPSTQPAIGLDFGLRSIIATSDGETIAPPRVYERSRSILRRAQRRVARRRRGSGRRQAAVQLLARLHERIANQRLDWHRKTAKDLALRFGVIAVEDLNIARMVSTPRANHKYPYARTGLNRGAQDAAWAAFITILARRAEEAGGRVIAVDPANTSQQCSSCGTVVPKTIFDRLHECPQCGLCIDQDVNAARNILTLALKP